MAVAARFTAASPWRRSIAVDLEGEGEAERARGVSGKVSGGRRGGIVDEVAGRRQVS